MFALTFEGKPLADASGSFNGLRGVEDQLEKHVTGAAGRGKDAVKAR